MPPLHLLPSADGEQTETSGSSPQKDILTYPEISRDILRYPNIRISQASRISFVDIKGYVFGYERISSLDMKGYPLQIH
jgi:hypothetical protein